MPFKIAPPKPEIASAVAPGEETAKTRIARRGKGRKGGNRKAGTRMAGAGQDTDQGEGQGSGMVINDPAPYEPIDLLYELTNNTKAYHAHGEDKSQLVIRVFPGYLSTAIKQIRASEQCITAPSQNLVMTVILTHGLRYFQRDEEILGIASIVTEYHRSGKNIKDSMRLAACEPMIEGMKMSAASVCPNLSKSTGLYLRIPDSLFQQVADRADVLGISKQDITILCTCLVLSSQLEGCCHPDYIRQARVSFEMFGSYARVRKAFMIALIEELKREPLPDIQNPGQDPQGSERGSGTGVIEAEVAEDIEEGV